MCVCVLFDPLLILYVYPLTKKYQSIILIRDARYWIFADIRYADIFQLILADTDADTDIFPFVWRQHQVSPVQKL